jgi:hypothetical protein
MENRSNRRMIQRPSGSASDFNPVYHREPAAAIICLHQIRLAASGGRRLAAVGGLPISWPGPGFMRMPLQWYIYCPCPGFKLGKPPNAANNNRQTPPTTTFHIYRID